MPEILCDRFQVVHTSGYPNEDNGRWQEEWAVHDTWDAWRVVARFRAYKHSRGRTREDWSDHLAERRRRALLYALALNRAEDGAPLAHATLKVDGNPNVGEWSAGEFSVRC